MLTFVADSAATLTTRYGNVAKATVGAIQRRLLVLEDQGGDHFFGEPAFDIHDLIRTTRDGRGYVSILAADRLMQSPSSEERRVGKACVSPCRARGSPYNKKK